MTLPIRLMLADVDGTLVTQDKVLTDEAIEAVHSLRKAGILFAITSGRPPRAWRCSSSPSTCKLRSRRSTGADRRTGT